MDEQILTTIVRNDKTKPLPLIEPFYFTFCHDTLLRPNRPTIKIPSVFIRAYILRVENILLNKTAKDTTRAITERQ